MLKLLKPLPRKVVVALSGGVDSTAAAHFLSRKHDLTAAFFHHGTDDSERAYNHLLKWCDTYNIPLLTGHIGASKPPRTSPEEWWRVCRYGWLDSLDADLGPVIAAHTLNDCVETYVWSALHGTPKVIPYQRNRVIRPFLTTPKRNLVDWCQRHSVSWIEDASNSNTAYTRNYIRQVVLPGAYIVNPGIEKMIKRIVDKQLAACDNRQLSTQES